MENNKIIENQEKSLLLQLTGSTPFFRIIDFLVDNKGLDFSKTEIAKGTKLSRACLFKYWKVIEKYQIVKISRRFGKTKLFTINTKNLITQKILDLELSLIRQAMEIKKQILIPV